MNSPPSKGRYAPVGRERSRQDRDEPKDALERLVENVGHLVLEVLRRDERVLEQRRPVPALERDDLAAGAAHFRVEVETWNDELIKSQRQPCGYEADA